MTSIDAILGLANLVPLDENAAAFRHDAKRLDALGDVLERHGDDEDIATFALKALVRLAADDGISKAIAELVGKVARAAPDLAEKPQTLAFELIAYLAVQKSSPRNDLVKNYCAHPTHWLISAQAPAMLENSGPRGPGRRAGASPGAGAVDGVRPGARSGRATCSWPPASSARSSWS